MSQDRIVLASRPKIGQGIGLRAALQRWALRVGSPSLVGAFIVLLALVAGFFSPILAPYDPVETDLGNVLSPPSNHHWIGTDDLGRDVLSRVISGAAASLQVGLIAVGLAMVSGVPLGLISGYQGGSVDQGIMRAVDAILAFPPLVLALGITAALGPSLFNTALAIGIVYMPRFARLVRGNTLSLRTSEFVDSARVAGAKSSRILFRHILPNTSVQIAVQASLSIGLAMIAEASLSFLGLGVPPPTPSWGGMLKVGYAYMEMAPWMAIAPGVAIVLTVWGFMMLGDGLSQALDPRQQQAMRASREA